MARLGKAIVSLFIYAWGNNMLEAQQNHLPQHWSDSIKRHSGSEATNRPTLVIDSAKVGALLLVDAIETSSLSPTPQDLLPTSYLRQANHTPSPLTDSPQNMHTTLQVGRLRLKSFSSQNNFVDLMGTKHEVKGFAVNHPIDKQISLTSSLTLGHTLLPYQPIPHQLLRLSIGANIRPTANSLIGLSASYERLMGYQAWRPEVLANIYLGERWRISALAGAAIYTQSSYPFANNGINYYIGTRIQYDLNNQWYLYGHTQASLHNIWSGSYSQPKWTQWTYAVGGGIGFNIKGAGPIELGLTYHYNPMSNRMEPMPSLNVFGLIGLIAKGIKSIFSDD